VKVVFINHMSANHLGGSELSLMTIIDRWTERNPSMSPIIVTPAPGAAMEIATRSRGWRTEVVPYSGWAVFEQEGGAAQALLRDGENSEATLRLVKLLRGAQPDLVVTNTVVAPWGALAAAMVGIPHAWFVREFGDTAQGFHYPDGRARALRDLGTLSATVFVNSFAIRDELAQFVSNGKLKVAYPWIDLDRVRSRAPEVPMIEPFSADAGLRVTVVGRITPSKGQWRVIEAIGLLASRGVRVDACFAGETLHRGDDRILIRRASRLGISDRIRFVGEQENPFTLMAAADLCVTPSDREAFGRATLEALAVGRPVLASHRGGSPELIEPGINGDLFDPDDVNDLALALERFALDPQRGRGMREASGNRAKQLNSATLDVDGVIDALEATRLAGPAVVPEYRRAWLDSLEERVAVGGLSSFLKARSELSRWGRRFRRLLRDPRPAVRRRLGRG
jgi:glycosyltransferase involved in cell wall biosynthesis